MKKGIDFDLHVLQYLDVKLSSWCCSMEATKADENRPNLLAVSLPSPTLACLRARPKSPLRRLLRPLLRPLWLEFLEIAVHAAKEKCPWRNIHMRQHWSTLPISIFGTVGSGAGGQECLAPPPNQNLARACKAPRRFGAEKQFYRCIWHRRLQGAYFLPSDNSRAT